MTVEYVNSIFDTAAKASKDYLYPHLFHTLTVRPLTDSLGYRLNIYGLHLYRKGATLAEFIRLGSPRIVYYSKYKSS